jgi:hypothetical protein
MKQIIVFTLSLFFISTAHASSERMYIMKNTSGACSGVISQATLEVVDGKPKKLLFPTATMTFENSSKIESKSKTMLLNEDGRLTKVALQLLSDKTISFKVVAEGEECSGMNIIFTPSE